jgi:hypothetical protein
MLGKEFIALLSRNISIGKGDTSSYSFGGLNVIICGDFHQFPPVAVGPTQALYYPIDAARDSVDSKIGRMIYEEFSTVVVLKEQKRVTDAVWLDFLRHLRVGNVQEHHLAMLRSLIVGQDDSGAAVDFDADPWSTAALVTPRHAVRTQWNREALRKMCKENGRRIYVCTADDTYKGRPLNLAERYTLATHLGKQKKGHKQKNLKDLPNTIEIAIGMKVMVMICFLIYCRSNFLQVTNNIETDLDLTNGARGEIVDIILDPDEPPVEDAPIVHLQKLPAYILVKLDRTRATKLDGLEQGVIAIEPTQTTYKVKFQLADGTWTQRTIRRRQFPMTAAYAFTDYRSQGQSIHVVLVDIASPPSGTLSLFNLYVALSRSSGRETIRLLRDFDDDLFMKSHDPVLLAEDDRLEALNLQTQRWWEAIQNRNNTEVAECQDGAVNGDLEADV